jgi:hypothetical protein
VYAGVAGRIATGTVATLFAGVAGFGCAILLLPVCRGIGDRHVHLVAGCGTLGSGGYRNGPCTAQWRDCQRQGDQDQKPFVRPRVHQFQEYSCFISLIKEIMKYIGKICVLLTLPAVSSSIPAR